LDDVAGQKRSFTSRPIRLMQNRAAVEMPSAADQLQPFAQRPRLSFPKDDGLIGPEQ
jgi:hypothetical protein